MRRMQADDGLPSNVIRARGNDRYEVEDSFGVSWYVSRHYGSDNRWQARREDFNHSTMFAPTLKEICAKIARD